MANLHLEKPNWIPKYIKFKYIIDLPLVGHFHSHYSSEITSKIICFIKRAKTSRKFSEIFVFRLKFVY